MKSASLLSRVQILSPDSSVTTLRSWIKQGRVTVDGEPVTRADASVEEGQEVKLLPKARFTDKGEIKILYQDRYLVVLDKPEGVLSVKAPFEAEKTLHKFLKATYGANRVKVVHRLDQGTSGVILFALEEKTYKELKKMFEKHELDRRYTAVVEGVVDEPEGSWHHYLWEDEAYRMHAGSDPSEGKEAITHYTVLRKSKYYTLIECRLETGRKNQIRVQAADSGFPIAGDVKYGAKRNPLGRMALHAHSLEFLHPILKKKLKVESPLPPSFMKPFEAHGKK
jgi:tRNA pseudouridine32 synthase/23S rRNA pseudouridine746 synthase/23S rRNA pseudouridine1911/1915/1917 synthase